MVHINREQLFDMQQFHRHYFPAQKQLWRGFDNPRHTDSLRIDLSGYKTIAALRLELAANVICSSAALGRYADPVVGALAFNNSLLDVHTLALQDACIATREC